jgi:hypothetical protein
MYYQPDLSSDDSGHSGSNDGVAALANSDGGGGGGKWWSEHFERVTKSTTMIALPCVCLISFLFNSVSLRIFVSHSLRNYKYFMYNSLFDLLLVLMTTIKPLLQRTLIDHLVDRYFYLFLMSVVFSVANICKCALLIERYSRMTGKFRLFTNRAHRPLVSLMIVLALVVNWPCLYLNQVTEAPWFKQTYAELVLNRLGYEQQLTYVLAYLYMIDMMPYVGMCVLFGLVKAAMKANVKKLADLLEMEKMRACNNEIRIEMNENTSERVLKSNNNNKEALQHVAVEKKQQTNITCNDFHRREEQKQLLLFESDDLCQLEENLCQKKKTRRFSSKKQQQQQQQQLSVVELEESRRKLCLMVLALVKVHLFSHAPLMIINLFEKIVSYKYGPLEPKASHNYYAYIDLLNSFSNFIFYSSTTANFFIYTYYNQKFRQIFKTSFKRMFFCYIMPRIKSI